MTENQYKPALEAILFTMGKAVEISRLAAAIDLAPADTRKVLETLQQEYAADDRGLELLFLEDKVQLCTKGAYYETLIRLASQPRKPVLTDVLLETLSIIAYKQPVTKTDIERVRGVKSDFAVNKLVEYGLIEEVGRLDTPGRPLLFATSEEFLRRFGLSGAADLPAMDPVLAEEIKEEAEEEIVV